MDIPAKTVTHPFLSIGFRPFYLGAAVFALLAMPFWILQFAGILTPPGTLAPIFWHAHEMVFGFAPAVIVGFLLTAVRNWTGRPTPSGSLLAALIGCWLLARLANLLGTGMLPVILDGISLLWAGLALSVPILQARNRRNYFVIGLLLGLTLMSVLHGLAIRGAFAEVSPDQATRLALDLILLLMVVIGGRVIPAFSTNAIPGLNARKWPAVEIAAIGSPLVLLVADAFQLRTGGSGWIALCTGFAIVHIVRLSGWQPWRTGSNPLLLALPAAYLWIPIHLLMRAYEPALALHALTVGAMASLMLAMMTRSALGHTGRPLAARTAEKLIFLAIHLAALSRVFGPMLLPGGYLAWLWLAAGFWTLAFGTFAFAYWPILTRPRLEAA